MMRGSSEKRVGAKQKHIGRTFEEEVDTAAEHEPQGRQHVGFAESGPYRSCQNGGNPNDQARSAGKGRDEDRYGDLVRHKAGEHQIRRVVGMAGHAAVGVAE